MSVDGARVAQGRDFAPTGELKSPNEVLHLDGERAAALASGLREQSFDVRAVESKPYKRSPYAPFRTTTLQQEASRKLGYGASRTMQVAQRLYENGFITYMRTDSVTLSETAIEGIKTNVPLHQELLLDAAFLRGGTSIHYLEQRLAKLAREE